MSLPLAVLAPVPFEHLVDGAEICRSRGRVAFGSQRWELFRELDERRAEGIPVLLYASMDDRTLGPVVSWEAIYIRYVESVGGQHPNGPTFRPTTTVRNREDLNRHWAGFYEVRDLHELTEEERIPIGELRDREGEQYRDGFVPEGPILISAPDR